MRSNPVRKRFIQEVKTNEKLRRIILLLSSGSSRLTSRLLLRSARPVREAKKLFDRHGGPVLSKDVKR